MSEQRPGWFAMKHGVSKHPLLKGKPERIAIWVWLLDNAAWQDTAHDINGKTIIVKRGQVAVSQRRLAEEVGVGRQIVRGFLERLTTERMVNPDATHGRTVLTLCNYEKYQNALKSGNPPPNPRPTHDQPIKEQDNNIPVGASASAPADLKKVVFDNGIEFLGERGIPEGRARPVIGRWVKAHGVPAVIDAIGRAQREGAIEPVSFIEGIFKHQTKTSDPEFHGAFGRIKEVG